MVGRVILAGLLAAGLICAQGKGKGGGGGRNSDMGSGMPRPQAQSVMEQISDKLKLNKEQKEEVANILNAAAESAAPVRNQINNGRQMITQAMVGGHDSGDDYTKLLNAYTGALAQMDGIEATAYGKIYALLKPNQQKGAEQVFAEQMSGIFLRGGGGGGGRKKSQ